MKHARKTVFTGAEGNRLTGEIWGSGGHPVLLLHGGGQTRHAWSRTAARLAENGMHAVAVDLRGHGDSEWVASGHYRFADYGRDAEALVEQLTDMFGEAPSGVGASLGGLSFLASEINIRPRLTSLVLVDIVPRMNRSGVSHILGFMQARLADGFGSLEEAADAIASYLPHRKRPRSLDGLRKNLRLCDDGRYRWHWDPAFSTGEYNIDRGAEAHMIALESNLDRLDLPVLLVRGMQSELVDEETARATVAAMPRGEYADVGGAGHMVAGDRNDVFCDAIVDFLRRVEAV